MTRLVHNRLEEEPRPTAAGEAESPASGDAGAVATSPGGSSTPSEIEQYYLGLLRQIGAMTGMDSGQSRLIGLTSSARHEGVTTIAVNLATAASGELSSPVLLVDANFAVPEAAEAIGAGSRPGLADLLSNPKAPLDDCLQPVQPSLHVLGPGSVAARRDANVRSERLQALLRELSQRYQLAVFDLPPASELTACLPIARCLDGVVLVVEAEKTRNQAVARAKRQLQQAGAEVLGVVLNKRRQHVPSWIYQRV